MITLIVARAKNGAIGKDNTIPWHAPEDLGFFRRETSGGVIIMGRKTWDSLPVKPLKNRDNLIVSTTMERSGSVLPSFADAVARAKDLGHLRIYAIGGASIYREALPLADRILVTEVDLHIDGADTFFPAIEAADWVCTSALTLRTEAPRCEVNEYFRTRWNPAPAC